MMLYIEPRNRGTQAPVIDRVTRGMTAAFRKAKRLQPGWWGFHTCRCGASSDNYDYELPNGAMTNSLCVHYLAFHRRSVPWLQLLEIKRFEFGEAEPTDSELRTETFRMRSD